jgi:hypothetical protein
MGLLVIGHPTYLLDALRQIYLFALAEFPPGPVVKAGVFGADRQQPERAGVLEEREQRLDMEMVAEEGLLRNRDGQFVDAVENVLGSQASALRTSEPSRPLPRRIPRGSAMFSRSDLDELVAMDAQPAGSDPTQKSVVFCGGTARRHGNPQSSACATHNIATGR